MNIGILGANGFIGTRLVEMLHLGGMATAVPIVRTPSGHAAFSRFPIESRVADALCRSSLEAAFAGCDVVVHAASGDRRLVVGSIEPVYRAAEAAGVRRLIYLSSLSVHGYDLLPGLDESERLHRDHEIDYCNWKVAAEQQLLSRRRGGSVEVVILRPGIVFGPRSSWIRDFATALLQDRAYVTNGGTGICPTIYVDNLVHAILRATEADVDGKIFFVGDDEMVSWKDLYQPITDLMGKHWADVRQLQGAPGRSALNRRMNRIADALRASRAWERVPPPLRRMAVALRRRLLGGATDDGEIAATREMTLLQSMRCRPSHSKAEALLGYDPPVSFEQGVQATLGWLTFAGYRPMTMTDWPGGRD